MALLGLGVLTYVLSRQLTSLFQRVAPAGALTVNELLKPGEVAPVLSVDLLGGGSRRIGQGVAGRCCLLFFLTPDCPICRSLLPAVRSIANAEPGLDGVLASDGGELAEHEAFVRSEGLQKFEYVISETLGRAYGISKLPYAVLIDEQGRIAAMGIVNSREHLESLLEAKERQVGSIQDFLESTGQADFHEASR